MKLFIDTSNSERIFIKLNDQNYMAAGSQKKAQALLPFINEKLKDNGKTIHDLTEIEVFTGPGSFTGLRVGVSVAQALGWSLNIPVNGKKAGEEEIEIKYS